MIENFKIKAEEHALEMAPKECCGVVVDGQYWRCRNIADNPEDDFILDPRDYAVARTFGPIQAIVHSHPKGGTASEADFKSQQQTKLIWHIFSIPENRWSIVNP